MVKNNDVPRQACEAPAWFREIDHTGDIGIEVSARDRQDLYARAAWGMFAMLTDLNTVAPRQAQTVTVEADDRDALLVRWLSELNFLHITEGWLFCNFEIEVLSERHLTARVQGERYDPGRHVLYTEIKAVTFHDLTIAECDEGWHARIIFDM